MRSLVAVMLIASASSALVTSPRFALPNFAFSRSAIFMQADTSPDAMPAVQPEEISAVDAAEAAASDASAEDSAEAASDADAEEIKPGMTDMWSQLIEREKTPETTEEKPPIYERGGANRVVGGRAGKTDKDNFAERTLPFLKAFKSNEPTVLTDRYGRPLGEDGRAEEPASSVTDTNDSGGSPALGVLTALIAAGAIACSSGVLDVPGAPSMTPQATSVVIGNGGAAEEVAAQ